ncbi:hypothetical protein ACFQGT_00150 [Natrialbaceae archaeon GCM10025810]
MQSHEIPTLKFADRHVQPILGRRKTATIRYDLEHTLRIGECVHLCDESGDRFASAIVSDTGYESAQWIADRGIDGHRSYRSVDELLAELETYYPDADLTPETCLDIVYWGEVWE